MKAVPRHLELQDELMCSPVLSTSHLTHHAKTTPPIGVWSAKKATGIKPQPKLPATACHCNGFYLQTTSPAGYLLPGCKKKKQNTKPSVSQSSSETQVQHLLKQAISQKKIVYE